MLKNTQVFIMEKPNVQWSDVIGHQKVKQTLQESVIMPLKSPLLFKRMYKSNFLLYGPPGTGKSLLVKACATESNATLFSISISDLLFQRFPEPEKIIATLFKTARDKKPSLILIYQIHEVKACNCAFRSDGENDSGQRVKMEFLTQILDEKNDNTGVFVFGTTNMPWDIDPYVRRVLDNRMMIPLPDEETRYQMFDKMLAQIPNIVTTAQKQYLAQKTKGYSGSDISRIIRDASLEPLRIAQKSEKFKQIQINDEQIKYIACSSSDPQGELKNIFDFKAEQLQVEELSIHHLELALQNCKPYDSQKDIPKHEQFTQDFALRY